MFRRMRRDIALQMRAPLVLTRTSILDYRMTVLDSVRVVDPQTVTAM